MKKTPVFYENGKIFKIFKFGNSNTIILFGIPQADREKNVRNLKLYTITK